MRAGLIGAGKVGFSLGKYLTEQGVSVSGYYSRSEASAAEAAAFTGTRYYENLAEITKDSDTLFVTVPDGAISDVWDDMRDLPMEDKNICHCSGSIPSTVFFDAEEKGAFRYSVHPLYAISDKYQSFRQLGKAHFSLEGSPQRLSEMKTFLERLGNKVTVIDPSSKTLYHAAAVMVSNQMAALADMGAELLTLCGFNRQDAEEALAPLIEGNAAAVASRGPVAALTGPVERGDSLTVAKHLEVLRHLTDRSAMDAEQAQKAGDIYQVYRILSTRLADIAARKHPERNYEELEKELKR